MFCYTRCCSCYGILRTYTQLADLAGYVADSDRGRFFLLHSSLLSVDRSPLTVWTYKQRFQASLVNSIISTLRKHINISVNEKYIQLLVHSSVIRSDYLSGGILTVICRTQQCEGAVTNRYLLTYNRYTYIYCLFVTWKYLFSVTCRIHYRFIGDPIQEDFKLSLRE